MADCECLAKCPFFNDKMANMPSMAEMMKNRYCRDEFTPARGTVSSRRSAARRSWRSLPQPAGERRSAVASA